VLLSSFSRLQFSVFRVFRRQNFEVDPSVQFLLIKATFSLVLVISLLVRLVSHFQVVLL
jgi:hypothetical protein